MWPETTRYGVLLAFYHLAIDAAERDPEWEGLLLEEMGRLVPDGVGGARSEEEKIAHQMQKRIYDWRISRGS